MNTTKQVTPVFKAAIFSLTACFAFAASARLPDKDSWDMSLDWSLVPSYAIHYSDVAEAIGKRGQFESSAEYAKRQQEALFPLGGKVSDPRAFIVRFRGDDDGSCTSAYDADAEEFQFSCRTEDRDVEPVSKIASFVRLNVLWATTDRQSLRANADSKNKKTPPPLRYGHLASKGALFGSSNVWRAKLPMPRDYARRLGNKWTALVFFEPQWPYGFVEVFNQTKLAEFNGKQVSHVQTGHYIIGQVTEVWMRQSDEALAPVAAKFDANGKLLGVSPELEKAIKAVKAAP